jgi:hypothetical protein
VGTVAKLLARTANIATTTNRCQGESSISQPRRNHPISHHDNAGLLVVTALSVVDGGRVLTLLNSSPTKFPSFYLVNCNPLILFRCFYPSTMEKPNRVKGLFRRVENAVQRSRSAQPTAEALLERSTGVGKISLSFE